MALYLYSLSLFSLPPVAADLRHFLSPFITAHRHRQSPFIATHRRWWSPPLITTFTMSTSRPARNSNAPAPAPAPASVGHDAGIAARPAGCPCQ
ncbi:hypothetical protein AHAS_Ahas02G0184300 [Arachis hypogaea]